MACGQFTGGLFTSHDSKNLTGGYHRTLVTGSDITMMVLKAADDGHSDYALARISLTISQITEGVPVPSAPLLMLPGAAMMIRRRLRGDRPLPVSRWLWKRPAHMGWA